MQINHRNDFKDVDSLAFLLSRVWEQISLPPSLSLPWEQINKLPSDASYLTLHLLKHSKDAEALIEKVETWTEDQQQAECEKQISILQEVKTTFVHSFVNPNLWSALYLSNHTLQKYLKWVVTAKENEKHVMAVIRELVTPIDVELVTSDKIKYIAEKLYKLEPNEGVQLQCTDFLILQGIIKHAYDVLQETTIKNCTELRYTITAYIEEVVKQFCSHLNKTKQIYELLFLYTLLYPFDYDIKRSKFWQLFNLNEVEYLSKEVEKQSIEFFSIEKADQIRLQAYLFNLTFSLLGDNQNPGLLEKAKIHVRFLQNELKATLTPQIIEILKRSYDCNDWTEMGSDMHTLYKGFQMENQSDGHNLQEILQAKDKKCDSMFQNLESASKHISSSETNHINKMLQKLGLETKYPEQLTTRDALLIRLETLGHIEQTNQVQTLPYLVLQKIMLCDSKSRECLFVNPQPTQGKSKIKEYKYNESDSNNDDDDDDDDDDDGDDDDSNSSDSDYEVEDNISPIDVIVALLHCSNNFLRQDLLRKLSLCQFAIPCILPNHVNQPKFLLFAMRSIIKAWKYLQNNKISYNECRIVDHPTPFITFLRLGKLEISKSAILNTVIGDSKQEYFFNWNCDGGNYKRLLTSGLVDLCWYLPSGHREDFCSDVLTFLNLHGNASKYTQQLEFITQVSCMLFILVDLEKIDKNTAEFLKKLSLNIPGGLTILCHTSNKKGIKYLTKHKVQFSMLPLKNKNDAEIRKEIRSHIIKKLADATHLLSLSECAQICRTLNITIDEDDTKCKYCKQLVQGMVMEKIKAYSSTTAKSKLLPLQGPSLWHKWAQHDKERNRHIARYKTSIEHYNSLKDSEKLKIRQMQLQFSRNLTPVMADFLNNLLQNEIETRKYFLEWMKLYFDDYSRTTLPQLHNEYQETRKLLLQLKDLSDNNVEIKELKYKLKQQNEHLAHASFGIEHFFREIGQIYEARMDPLQDSKDGNLVENLHELPKIVAHLLNDGYPMEIMDGDASHVPITWVLAVLEQLKWLHGSKKLLIISVLGIQSTGKSTLLNTMFGLQFNVSAGRCTRGVFLQLLPVDDQLHQKLNCDLIIIIDTEGLRAPELQFEGTQAHDNELATFVIGLADVTIINIYGETPGDLDDILQTAIHAFIRMKKMTFYPKCHFVHQNVSDVSASDKGKVGRQKFLDNLDKITEAAAKIEHCEGQFKYFKSVIAFDEENDVHFFPALWKGDPPMAPVNPGYSKQAQRLKSIMVNQVSDITEGDASLPLCTFVEFEKRLKYLWDSVLQENYIFSFKNSLEIVAYNELDTHLNQWSWQFQDELQKWQLKTENKINSVSESSDLGSKSKECLDDGLNISKVTHQTIMSKVTEFFEHNEHAVTLSQWRGRTEERMLQLQIEFDESITKICKTYELRKQDRLTIEDLKANKRKKLQKHIEKLVTESKKSGEELTDTELQNKFETKWDEWKKELSSTQNVQFTTAEEIYSIVEKQFKNLYKSQHKYVIEELNKHTLQNREVTETFIVDGGRHLKCRRKWYSKLFWGIQEEDTTEANKKTKEFLNATKQLLLDYDCQNFSEIMIVHPLKELRKSITSFNACKNKFAFSDVYIAEMAIVVGVYASKHCIEMMERYKEMHDPLISLENLKPTFKLSFVNQCKEISSDKAAADNFCQLLIEPVEAQLIKAFPGIIKSEIKQSNLYFASKKSLKCMLLTNLATLDDFENYKILLNNAEVSYKWCIQCCIEEYYDQMVNTKKDDNEGTDTKQDDDKGTDTITEPRLINLAKQHIDNIFTNITKAVTETTANTNPKSWLTEFHSKLNGAITLTLTELTDMVGDKTFNSCDFFSAEVKLGLNEQQQKMKKLSETLQLELKKTYAKATDLLFNYLSGCTEQCPFCHEYCEMSVCDHLKTTGSEFHSISIHRPQCLAKFRDLWSNKLVIDLCTSLVGSDYLFDNPPFFDKPYKEYQKYYTTWTIQHDAREVPLYWKWFVARYNSKIAEWCNAKPGDIPPEWFNITKDQAINSLKKTYDL